MTAPSSEPIRLRLDIVSDIVCPWCAIGFATFETVLAEFADRLVVDLHWQPFELNPQMPAEGQDLREHVYEKYGTSPEQSRGARDRIAERAAAVGFPLRFADDMRIRNTFAAHQLMAWASAHGDETAMMKALFDAYFVRHEDVSDVDVLADVATRVGLDANAAGAALRENRYADAVRHAEREWVERGIQAVPGFVFDERGLLTGAQDAAVFRRVLERVVGDR